MVWDMDTNHKHRAKKLDRLETSSVGIKIDFIIS